MVSDDAPPKESTAAAAASTVTFSSSAAGSVMSLTAVSSTPASTAAAPLIAMSASFVTGTPLLTREQFEALKSAVQQTPMSSATESVTVRRQSWPLTVVVEETEMVLVQLGLCPRRVRCAVKLH